MNEAPKVVPVAKVVSFTDNYDFNAAAFQKREHPEFAVGCLPGGLSTRDLSGPESAEARSALALVHPKRPPFKWLTADAFDSFHLPCSPDFNAAEIPGEWTIARLLPGKLLFIVLQSLLCAGLFSLFSILPTTGCGADDLNEVWYARTTTVWCGGFL
jgi:hypothetical protein